MHNLNSYHHKSYINLNLNFCVCGAENCLPTKKVGPRAPDYYVFHFIISGAGTYKTSGQSFHLKAGEGFLIYPGQVCYYTPDFEDPWSYYWVGFKGESASTLTHPICTFDNPIFTHNTESIIVVKNIYQFSKNNLPLELKTLQLTSYLYSMFYELTSPLSNCSSSTLKKQQYLTYSVHYISEAYHRHLTVEEIANNVHIDRTYLFSIFKAAYNISPKQFIINYRMDKASYFLRNTQLTAKEISYSVGYVDYSLFSRIFKKVKGTSPNVYRYLKK
ncbi:AraC family transcriptional regulator [Clostridium sp.]